MTDTARKAGDMNPDLACTVWCKSSYSGQSQNCVEVAGNLSAAVSVRDSKDPHGPALVFAPSAWRSFIARVKTGQSGQQ